MEYSPVRDKGPSRRAFLSQLASLALTATAGRSAPSDRRFQVGVCAPTADFDQVERFGFDYLEAPAAEISAMSEAQFRAFRAQVLASRLRCRAFNNFTRTFRIVGPDASPRAHEAYLDICLPRCRELGGEIVVWGSAGSRNVPDGYSRDRAWAQIVQFLQMAGERARPLQLIIAIEPLSHPESNIINTAAEALRLVREVDHPNVRMIVDFYHLRRENEDPEIIFQARSEIVHFHFANPQGRRWPKDPGEDPEYAHFFQILKKIGYGGGISIEGRGSLQQDAVDSLAFFRGELSLRP
ncbi:MAG TPA: sugar phosphate isomerase/epimerase family protein [Terriglobia bacterium]|nr:sugar phosphate isomerase/epimerase family protein [Terriglobia bacterium]